MLHASSTILSFQSSARLRCLSRINPSILLCRLSSHHFKLSTARQFSAVINTAHDNSLLDPYDILRRLSKKGDDDTQISFPTYLSPTKLESFSKCPQAFFFLYILQLTPDPPMTPQLARGIICHKALEDLYDLKPDDRSLANLENLFRREWCRLRGERGANATILTTTSNVDDETKMKHANNEYDTLFREIGNEGQIEGYDLKSEIEWGRSSIQLLRNYYSLEDPRTLSPIEREMWVNAHFSTSTTTTDSNNAIDFVVRGKIDRIDLLPPSDTSSNKLQLQIIDYKTGKKPWLKYSHKVNERIAKEQFWKMKVYCLILWKMVQQTDMASEQEEKDGYKYGISWTLQQRLASAMNITPDNTPKWSNMLEINSLRLTYLTSHVEDASANGLANYLDYSLDSKAEFESILMQTEHEVQTIACQIKELVDTQSPHAFKHCDWKYCSCHELRKRFIPGSVYQSEDI